MSLEERIKAEIASGGPIPFERFMGLALYDADGYFGGESLRSVRSGDFLTSPEVSPLFGETLARWVITEWERIGDPFQLVEVAAGSGSLLAPLLRVVEVPAIAVEVSPAARRELSERLPHIDVVSTLPDDIRGVVVANELADNLPMALAQRAEAGWRERWVGLDGDRLELVDASPRPEALDWLTAYAGDVPTGGWVEVQLEATRWVEQVLSRMSAGSLVLIDYGDTAENLLPRRADGTLRTYRAHHLGPHPLDEPGATDITADVNFTALTATARAGGAVVDLMRQDVFLAELGLRDRLTEVRHAELAATRAGDSDERLRLRSLRTEIETLLHPRGLGDFRVMVARR
ncbi:MAG: SAM-dependent methyltransferase [Actinobacteria bacterium]|nr:SAM-dependent methyltransferase [Actinomycetota bacterium]